MILEISGIKYEALHSLSFPRRLAHASDRKKPIRSARIGRYRSRGLLKFSIAIHCRVIRVALPPSAKGD